MCSDTCYAILCSMWCSLTDDVSRENWEKWGNPDGPQAASFGIALPAWIVEKQNSLWVLVAYMSVFMIALPLIVVSGLGVVMGVWCDGNTRQ